MFVYRATIHWLVNEEACLAEDRDRYKNIKSYVFLIPFRLLLPL